MGTPNNPPSHLPRAFTIPLYLINLGFIAYCVNGAMNGSLALSSKSGPFVIQGTSAWLFCLILICGFSVLLIRIDPSPKFTLAARQRIGSVAVNTALLSLVGLVAALILEARP
jgi:hypothetical protein